MVKNTALSPLSFLAGIGAAGLCLTLLGMSPVQGGSSGSGQGLKVFPHPRDLVRILEGDSYVVPAGKILTIKTLTVARGEFFGSLKINGQDVLGMLGQVRDFELGVTAQPGETVTVEEYSPDPFRIPAALGFLVDE